MPIACFSSFYLNKHYVTAVPNPKLNTVIGPHFRGALSVVIGTVMPLGSAEPGMQKFLFANFVQCSILMLQNKDGRERSLELVGTTLLVCVQG